MGKEIKGVLKKEIREIERQIKELTANMKKIELKGCFSDRELQDKEFILENHRKRINALEKEKGQMEMALRSKGG